MPCRLLVILGAGASHDCATVHVPDRNEQYQPPLVTELFAPRSSFARILHHYPLAESAAADIRPALAGGSVAVEAFLRDRLKESEYEHDRRRYYAIPLYLQHLFFEIGAWDYRGGPGYTAQPDAYDRLINAALRVDEVTFVTLNYDDLFDRRLFIYAPLTSMESYVGEGQNWSLIKLHGSVNWGRVVLNDNLQVEPSDPLLAQTFARLGEHLELQRDITLRLEPDLLGKRLAESPFQLFYPALSAPLGAKDELVCPAFHVEYVKERLGHWDPLDVLVIGYSGLDEEVLDLLSEGQRAIRSLAVVNGTEEAGAATARKILERVTVVPAPGQERATVFPSGFSEFVQGADLEDYVNRIRSSAKAVDEASRAIPG